MNLSKWKAAALAGVLATGWAGLAQADNAQEAPQLGGTVNISTVFASLDATTWDLQNWTWKGNQDNLQMETLMRGDLQAGPRGRGETHFIADAYFPLDQTQGALAESWEVKQDPPRVIFHLRKGVQWQAVPGVMKSRELVASDVIHTFEAREKSPRAIPEYWDFVDHWSAPDDHTVVAHFKEFNANWPYKLGWGYYNGILPDEWRALSAAQRSDWHNTTGTGPYRIESIETGRQQVYVKNDHYWDSTTIDGKKYQLPLNDKVIYHIIKDPTSAVAALASGRLDIMERVRWQSVDRLKKAAPQLIFHRYLYPNGTYVALRTDEKPFNDVRVRRAMNLAVDQKAILASVLNGEGELLNYPFNKNWKGYYIPLDKLSKTAQELFDYKPEEAKKLLAEAGYPNGFTFTLQVCSCSAYHMDLVPMLQAYYQQVGIKMNVQTLEYGAYRSMMGNKNQAAGYLIDNSNGNPLGVMRKSYLTGQTWNASRYSNPEVDKQIYAAIAEPDHAKRTEMLRKLDRYIIEDAVPQVWLPTQVNYSAWWPWVKNYHGELRTNAMGNSSTYARIWIDQQLKKKILSE